MATRPQEVSLNLANVKFFSSSKHFQIQSLKLTVWFRALKRRGGGDGEGKKKRYTKEKRTDNTLTTKDHYVIFPQIPRSNQFCPSPKNNRPVPRSVSRRYSRREHRRVQISGTCRIRSQSRSCRARPRIVEGKKKKERRKKGKKRVGGCCGLVPHPQLPPFFVSLFPRPLTFFHTLLATRLSLSPSFVIDYTSRSRCCCRLRRRKEEINDDTDKLI